MLESGFFGGGIELNGNTRSGIAFGGGLSFGMDFVMNIPDKQNQNFSAGIRTSLFSNFDTVIGIEPMLFLRYYLPFEFLRLPKEEDGLFVQAELGAIILMESGYHDYREAVPAFAGGLAAGWRFNLGEYWFADPMLRIGYPHIWGISVTAGFKIKSRSSHTIVIRELVSVIRDQIEEDVVIIEDQIIEEDLEEPEPEIEIEEEIIPDDTPPVVTVSHSPELFNPTEGDVITFELSAVDDSGIASWKLEIFQPEPRSLFFSVTGEGEPPAQFLWDGYGSNGELVQSATDYPYVLTAEDPSGNVGSSESLMSVINVDVYAVEDEDGNLRMQVPSIIFRADHADFIGLSAEIIENRASCKSRLLLH